MLSPTTYLCVSRDAREICTSNLDRQIRVANRDTNLIGRIDRSTSKPPQQHGVFIQPPGKAPSLQYPAPPPVRQEQPFPFHPQRVAWAKFFTRTRPAHAHGVNQPPIRLAPIAAGHSRGARVGLHVLIRLVEHVNIKDTCVIRCYACCRLPKG